jgi:transposase
MQVPPEKYVPEHLSTDAQEIIASLMQEKALWEQEKSALVAAHEAEKMRQMAELSRLYEADKAHLQARIAELTRLIFGVKSERFVPAQTDPGQLKLELEGLQEVVTAHKQIIAEHERAVHKKPDHHGRLPIPEHIERVDEIIEPQEDITGMKHIGDEITEVLEYQPGKLWVRRIRRPKYARQDAPEGTPGVVMAPMPDQAFPRCKAGVSLLVYLLLGKFGDHLPLYRMSQILARQGIKIPDNTIGEWVKMAVTRLDSLYKCYKVLILQSAYLQMDETRLQVLEESKKGKAHLGYIWVLFDPVRKLPFYTYLPGRSHHGPKTLLEPFRGYLQSDGYSVYELLNKIMPNITLLNCMAHARREFHKALDNDRERAAIAMEKIQTLYKIEEHAREQGMNHEQRLALRRQQALPVWQELCTWLEAQMTQVLPKSQMGQAVAYTLRRKEALGCYLTDGKLEIDNNLVENAIRPIAIGRKNYLFAGNHEAAQRNAMMYTLLNACKQHGVNPQEWLQDVLGNLHRHSNLKLEELLPHRWKSMQDTTSENQQAD